MGKNKDKEKQWTERGVTRRGFLQIMGAGAGAVASIATYGIAPDARAEIKEPAEMVKVTLRINGRRHRVLVEPRWSLLFVLREKLGSTGTKMGCERGECGACTVLVDGQARYGCMTLALEAEGKEITTIEGLMKDEELGPVQQAFLEHDAFQCGYCTPGQIMAVEGLLRSNPNPSFEEVRRGLSGNLCRCGTYDYIFKAAERAAQLRKR